MVLRKTAVFEEPVLLFSLCACFQFPKNHLSWPEGYLLESCFWSCRTRAAVCCCCCVCCKPCLGNCNVTREKGSQPGVPIKTQRLTPRARQSSTTPGQRCQARVCSLIFTYILASSDHLKCPIHLKALSTWLLGIYLKSPDERAHTPARSRWLKYPSYISLHQLAYFSITILETIFIGKMQAFSWGICSSSIGPACPT